MQLLLIYEMIVSSGYSGASVVCCDLDIDVGGVRIIDSIVWDLHSAVSQRERGRTVDTLYYRLYM